MRPDRLYLLDIPEATEKISQFVVGLGEESFKSDELLQSAVLQKLTTIGEACSRLSHEIRLRFPGVPWRDVIAFRNIAVHAYFSVDWSIVWVAATQDAPTLRDQIQAILDAETD